MKYYPPSSDTPSVSFANGDRVYFKAEYGWIYSFEGMLLKIDALDAKVRIDRIYDHSSRNEILGGDVLKMLGTAMRVPIGCLRSVPPT